MERPSSADAKPRSGPRSWSADSLWPRTRRRARRQCPAEGAAAAPSHRSRATSCPGRKCFGAGLEGAEPEGDLRRRSLRQRFQDAVVLLRRVPKTPLFRAPGPDLVWSRHRVHSEPRNSPLETEQTHWDLDHNLNQIRIKTTARNLDQINGNCPISWTDLSPGPGPGPGPSSGGLSLDPDPVPDCVLVPDLLQISNSPCYWGVMDRLEAESLLEGAPEGTFLLRDSAHSQVLFSVSFRRYSRSLHARIEQSGLVFSFDSGDPGMYRDPSVGGLLRHYSDPQTCLFFEPLLAHALPRTFPFSLQHLARCVICSCTTFSGLQLLPLPLHLKEYLTHYHLKS